MSDPLRLTAPKLLTLCPECGPDVQIDGDGCCMTCGADAHGRGVDQVRELVQSQARELAEARELIEEMADDLDGWHDDHGYGPGNMACAVVYRARAWLAATTQEER